MRRLSLVTALLPALLACPPDRTDPVAPTDALVTTKTPDKVPAVAGAEGDTLRGTKVMVDDRGPWKQRRLASAGSPAVLKARRGGEGAGSGGLLGLIGGTKGAPPRPAAAPMEEMVAAEPEAPADTADYAGGPGMKRAKPAMRALGGETATGRGFGSAAQGVPAPEAQPASPLRAGSTDDNADFDGFLKFLAEWTDRPDTAGQQQLLDVRDRRFIRVLDRDGKPVPAAEVQIRGTASGQVIYAGTTFGDGQAPFYPRVYDPGHAAGDYLVEVSYGGQRVSRPWPSSAQGAGSTLEVALAVARDARPLVALDVLFVIDTTGSMGDEIDQIKRSLLSVTDKLRGLQQEFDLRYGAVLYRDVTDEYLTATHAFTGDIEAFDGALKQVSADGGGDGPESLNQGLAQAMHGVQWRPGAAKVAFLIADAPPHMDYQDDVPYGESLKDAVALGVRVHSVAASGLDPFGTLVFRQSAQFTRGKFIFIEYGSTAASAAQHGVTGQVQSNNLDDIIFRQLSWEVASWGRP